MLTADLWTNSDQHQTVDCVHPDDAGAPGKRPGVVVVHEWMGHNDYARRRANMLAELGYVAFALDMYGKGVKAKNAQEAAQMAGRFKSDRKLMRERAAAGLEVLKKQPTVDTNRLAAMGYCFGGQVALELARSGADLKGIVTFHGALDTPTPQDAKNIKGKVLACHGEADPFVPDDQVNTFRKEMNDALRHLERMGDPSSVKPLGEAWKQREDLLHRLRSLGPRARQEGADLQVFLDAEAREHLPPLGDLPDAQVGGEVRVHPGDGVIAEGDRSGPRPLHAGDRTDERRLSGAVRAHERDQLARGDLEGNGRERLRIAVIEVELANRQHQAPGTSRASSPR